MRTKRQLSEVRFGETMTRDEAVEWLGADHVAWCERDPAGASGRMQGAWMCNNGASYEAYGALGIRPTMLAGVVAAGPNACEDNCRVCGGYRCEVH